MVELPGRGCGGGGAGGGVEDWEEGGRAVEGQSGRVLLSQRASGERSEVQRELSSVTLSCWSWWDGVPHPDISSPKRTDIGSRCAPPRGRESRQELPDARTWAKKIKGGRGELRSKLKTPSSRADGGLLSNSTPTPLRRCSSTTTRTRTRQQQQRQYRHRHRRRCRKWSTTSRTTTTSTRATPLASLASSLKQHQHRRQHRRL